MLSECSLTPEANGKLMRSCSSQSLRRGSAAPPASTEARISGLPAFSTLDPAPTSSSSTLSDILRRRMGVWHTPVRLTEEALS